MTGRKRIQTGIQRWPPLPPSRMCEPWPGTTDDVLQPVHQYRHRTVRQEAIQRHACECLALQHVPGPQKHQADGHESAAIAQLLAQITKRLERR